MDKVLTLGFISLVGFTLVWLGFMVIAKKLEELEQRLPKKRGKK